MAEARIKAGMWVSAALRLAFNEGRGGAVLRRGDADAGGILLVLRGEAGLKVLTQPPPTANTPGCAPPGPIPPPRKPPTRM